MILNEDYFEDLEINDEDIIEDDYLDVEEPEPNHELTVEEAKKLPEQYGHFIRIEIDKDRERDRDTTFIQTSLIPRLFKRLDTIFEYYGIDDYKYILSSIYDVKICETVVKFGNYQLFCQENEEDVYTNDIYHDLYINVYVNYPKFNYKRAFHFLYTLLPNLYRMDRHIKYIRFCPFNDDYVTTLYFWFNFLDGIRFVYYNRTNEHRYEISLYDEKDKRKFYYSVFYHFFKKGVSVPYELIDRDVPLKPLRV